MVQQITFDAALMSREITMDVPILKQQEFANQIELHRYAELNDLAYAWAYTRAFGRWQQLLTPGEYKLACHTALAAISLILKGLVSER